jgi:hypothetical protein
MPSPTNRRVSELMGEERLGRSWSLTAMCATYPGIGLSQIHPWRIARSCTPHTDVGFLPAHALRIRTRFALVLKIFVCAREEQMGAHWGSVDAHASSRAHVGYHVRPGRIKEARWAHITRTSRPPCAPRNTMRGTRPWNSPVWCEFNQCRVIGPIREGGRPWLSAWTGSSIVGGESGLTARSGVGVGGESWLGRNELTPNQARLERPHRAWA